VCDYIQGLDLWINLLTTNTYDSEIQAITAPPLTSTIHTTPQHPLSLFQPVAFTRRFLVTASNNGYSSSSVLKTSLQRLFLRTLNWLSSNLVSLITSRHGPPRKHSSSIVVVQLSHLLKICPLAIGTCFPSRCPETAVVCPPICAGFYFSPLRGAVPFTHNTTFHKNSFLLQGREVIRLKL
jgi:hypothetical protein